MDFRDYDFIKEGQKKADQFKTHYIKLRYEGKLLNLAIIKNQCDPETGYMYLVDEETQEHYSAMKTKGKITITSKVEKIYGLSYDEYLEIKKQDN